MNAHPESGESGSGVPPLNQDTKQKQYASAKSAAPTGQNKSAQGKERSAAALGHESQNAASPEGAKEIGGWPRVKSGDLLAFVTSGSRGWARYYNESGPLF